MKLKILLLSFLAVFLSASIVGATTIPFGDNENYWPGWGNASGDDINDTIGVPNITGGTAEVNSGYLAELTFNRSPGDHLYNVISPGDLFIDIGSNDSWDYVIDLTNWSTSGPSVPDPGSGKYYIYALSGDWDFILSGNDKTGYWSNYNIRDDHPAAWKNTQGWQQGGVGQIWFSGWGNGSTTSYTFDFTGTDLIGALDVGGSFTIGWTLNCANDVIYEQVPVPEPSTMLLFGTGFLGLAMIGRKKLFKK